MQTDKNIRGGMSPDAARRAARIEFGGEERFREEQRDARGSRLVEDAIADVRYAACWLFRSPGFAIAAILTLGLGIAEPPRFSPSSTECCSSRFLMRNRIGWWESGRSTRSSIPTPLRALRPTFERCASERPASTTSPRITQIPPMPSWLASRSGWPHFARAQTCSPSSEFVPG